MDLSDTILSWVGDFVDSTRFRTLPHAVRDYAEPALSCFLETAWNQIEPPDLDEASVRAGLIEGVAQLDLPASVKPDVPELVRAFLETLEDQGRVAGGRDLGVYAGALHQRFQDATATKPRPIQNVASKLGRNDPCPCGSGKKYKKCCMRLLD